MDYTAPDKIVGSNWTAAEHNQLKQAVNSKLDADAVVQDLTSPSNAKVLSTSAINNLMAVYGGARNRGNLTGSENIDEGIYKTPGVWMPVDPFQNPAHASFPSGKPGLLRVNENPHHVVQEYIFIDGSGMAIRTYDGSTWSAWTEFVGKSWIIEQYGNPANILPDGTPTIEGPDPDNIIVTPFNCIDTAGRVSVSNQSLAGSTIGMLIHITPQYPRNVHGLIVDTVGPGKSFSNYSTGESGDLYIRIDQDIPIGNDASFCYITK